MAEQKKEITKIKEDIARAEKQRDSLELNEAPRITEEILQEVINTFSEQVRSRDKKICKRFIKDFIDRIIVYPGKVQVNLKIPESAGSLIMQSVIAELENITGTLDACYNRFEPAAVNR